MTEDELPDPIRTFIDATNRGDTEAFVAAFTEDAHLDDYGRGFDGHDGVRSWNATDNIGVHAHFAFVAAEPGHTPGTYALTVDVTGNGYNGRSPLHFTLTNTHIQTLTIP
jgi:hypothetical protein